MAHTVASLAHVGALDSETADVAFWRTWALGRLLSDSGTGSTGSSTGGSTGSSMSSTARGPVKAVGAAAAGAGVSADVNVAGVRQGQARLSSDQVLMMAAHSRFEAAVAAETAVSVPAAPALPSTSISGPAQQPSLQDVDAQGRLSSSDMGRDTATLPSTTPASLSNTTASASGGSSTTAGGTKSSTCSSTGSTGSSIGSTGSSTGSTGSSSSSIMGWPRWWSAWKGKQATAAAASSQQALPQSQSGAAAAGRRTFGGPGAAAELDQVEGAVREACVGALSGAACVHVTPTCFKLFAQTYVLFELCGHPVP